jgi:hypothetical protein
MKTMIGMTVGMVLIVAIFALLGLAEANHMLIFGLLLAMFSGLAALPWPPQRGSNCCARPF